LSLGREPKAQELAILRTVYEAQYESASSDPKRAAKLIGDTSLPKEVTANELAAWYAVATTLMNLDEAVTKE
jgi:hypothetical protein